MNIKCDATATQKVSAGRLRQECVFSPTLQQSPQDLGLYDLDTLFNLNGHVGYAGYGAG